MSGVQIKKPFINKKQNKILTIIVLAVVAGILVFLAARDGEGIKNENPNVQIGLKGRPVPELSTTQQRIDSYTPAKGEIKYRIVPKPIIGLDPESGWNLYTSTDYGFSFTYPLETKILDNTEALGYQLPANLSYKGSRDTFQIVMQGKNNSYFMLLMNDLNFGVASTTVTASSTVSVNGLKMLKEIWDSTDTQFKTSQIITYSFEKDSRGYIWYGTFDNKDFESINDFQSIVTSTSFKK